MIITAFSNRTVIEIIHFRNRTTSVQTLHKQPPRTQPTRGIKILRFKQRHFPLFRSNFRLKTTTRFHTTRINLTRNLRQTSTRTQIHTRNRTIRKHLSSFNRIIENKTNTRIKRTHRSRKHLHNLIITHIPQTNILQMPHILLLPNHLLLKHSPAFFVRILSKLININLQFTQNLHFAIQPSSNINISLHFPHHGIHILD
ncbi:hypothetical protein Hanom_Chr04g00291291 [Helianthus anomalus]